MKTVTQDHPSGPPSRAAICTLVALLISSVVLLLIAEAWLLAYVFVGDSDSNPATPPHGGITRKPPPVAHPAEIVLGR